jgi:hypothetical protein
MAASRSACRARSASRTFTSAFFQSHEILDSTRYSSQPLFRERRISAALAEFLECPSCLVLRHPNVRRIRLLKDLDPLHPWLANLRRFPHHACARRQLSLPQEYQCQRYAKRGASAETIGDVATNTAITRFAIIEPTTAATTSAISTQRV